MHFSGEKSIPPLCVIVISFAPNLVKPAGEYRRMVSLMMAVVYGNSLRMVVTSSQRKST